LIYLAAEDYFTAVLALRLLLKADDILAVRLILDLTLVWKHFLWSMKRVFDIYIYKQI